MEADWTCVRNVKNVSHAIYGAERRPHPTRATAPHQGDRTPPGRPQGSPLPYTEWLVKVAYGAIVSSR